MTNLNQFNESTNQNINELELTIKDLKQQLIKAQRALETVSQIQTYQQTVTTKWEKTTLPDLRQTFKDACSYYNSVEAIDAMLADIQAIAEEIKNQFVEEDLGQQFLDKISDYSKTQLEAELTENLSDNLWDKDSPQTLEILPKIAEAEEISEPVEELPPEDDNKTWLTENQILQIISPLTDLTLDSLKKSLNLHGKLKKSTSIAKAIASKGTTYYELLFYIKSSTRLMIESAS